MGYNQHGSPVPVTNSTTALISLLAGIGGFTILPILGSIVAVVTGHMAKNEINKSMGSMGGGGMATIGLILGYLGLGLTCIGVCITALMLLGVLTAPACLIPIFDGFYY
jgi:hypothetical protein